MKAIYYLLLFFFLLTGKIYSQSSFWGEQNSGVTVSLNSISAFTINGTGGGARIWACGNSGTVIKSTNDGVNWTNVSGGGIPNTVSLVNVWSINGDSALVTGYSGTTTWVWKTANGGTNWVQVFSQANGRINFIAMKQDSTNKGIMVGNPVGGRWSIWKTTNAGTTWDSIGRYLPQSGTELGFNNSFCYLNSRIWFGTNNSRIYYSSNNGANWLVQSTAPEINIYAIHYLSDFNGDGIAGGSTLMQTSNFGTNWVPLTGLGSGNIGGFAGLGLPVENLILGQIWYVRNNSNIYKSLMGGVGWHIEYNTPTGNYNHITRDRFGMHIWAVRNNGGITRCTCFVSGIEKTSSIIPEIYNISQNYPNPFNPETNFDIDIKKSGKVKLNIYDQLGRFVTTIVDRELTAGTYKVSWNATSNSSGIYYYTLIAGDFTITKKMMLIK